MRILVLLVTVMLFGCQSKPLPPVAVAEEVDLPRFMGCWFVLAHIPLPPEKNGWNGVEHYRLDEQGRVATTFTFREGGPDGELKRYTPVAYVTDDPSNAIWKMQFLWPFKADFRISWLDEDYQLTVIGRKKRDYVWVMARTPEISAQRWQEVEAFLAGQGYDMTKLRRMPQQWSGTPGYGDEDVARD
ncbi:MAG: lipocalin family protein [Alcanivoracaceae bacterium]|nr:lipocalin family protein [Alcanivoracaceae bacterium]